MKIIGVIPARYQSSRFPGKPLADICGRPMIWWVYRQALKVEQFADVFVATDDERIQAVCEQYGMKVVMTSSEHPTGSDRVAEVASKVEGDLFIKTHPRDTADYEAMFPEAVVLDRFMPSELLDYCFEVRFARAVGLRTASVRNLRCADEKICLEDAYMAPYENGQA